MRYNPCSCNLRLCLFLESTLKTSNPSLHNHIIDDSHAFVILHRGHWTQSVSLVVIYLDAIMMTRLFCLSTRRMSNKSNWRMSKFISNNISLSLSLSIRRLRYYFAPRGAHHDSRYFYIAFGWVWWNSGSARPLTTNGSLNDTTHGETDRQTDSIMGRHHYGAQLLKWQQLVERSLSTTVVVPSCCDS